MNVIATSLKDNEAIAFTSGTFLPSFHHRTYPMCHQSGCSLFGCMIFLYYFDVFVFSLGHLSECFWCFADMYGSLMLCATYVQNRLRRMLLIRSASGSPSEVAN